MSLQFLVHCDIDPSKNDDAVDKVNIFVLAKKIKHNELRLFLRSIILFYFWQKQNYIHSFKLRVHQIKYHVQHRYKCKGKSLNKLTTPKLIVYNDKMPTNNIINSKSSKYSCFQICNFDAQIIDWICNWLKLIFQ